LTIKNAWNAETCGQPHSLGTLQAGFALWRPGRTSKDGDRQERFNPIRAENHAQSRKIAPKKGLKIAEKMNQAYFLSYIALISIYKLK
jgi:hypothetical protein